MGGRNPKSPQIIPSKPPKGMMGGPLGLFGGVIGGITGSGGRREPSPFPRIPSPPQRKPSRDIPPMSDVERQQFKDIFESRHKDKRVRRNRRRVNVRGRGGIGPRRDPIRNRLTREERMKIKAKAEERRKLRKEKGFAERGTLDKQRRPVNRVGRRIGRRRRKRGESDFIVPAPGIPRDRLSPRPPVSGGRGESPIQMRPNFGMDGRTGRRRPPVNPGTRTSDAPIPIQRRRPPARRRRPPTAVMETTQVVVRDPTLGGAPEREVPIPKERLPKITRESDPRGPAPFAPNERAMAKERFFERMFEKADERKQQKSMMREERKRVKQSRRDESRMRMNEPGELNVGGEIKI